jgi:hypothetical protein
VALVESRLLHHLTLRHRILVHVLLDGMGHYCLVATLVQGERGKMTGKGERERERKKIREREREKEEREIK